MVDDEAEIINFQQARECFSLSAYRALITTEPCQSYRFSFDDKNFAFKLYPKPSTRPGFA
jgi:hypothetical protein